MEPEQQSRSIENSVSADVLDRKIAILEERVKRDVDNAAVLKSLLYVLDYHSPEANGLGPFADRQRLFNAEIQDSNWVDDILKPGQIARNYLRWRESLVAKGVNFNIPIAQLHRGQILKVKNQRATCGVYLSFFKQQSVIPSICHDCFKVQILPQDLTGLMQTYFILRRLRLPKDNHRKCMIELREDVVSPYKGYIFCDCEEDVKTCLELFQQSVQEHNIQGIHCRISHGCSEYGLKFPEFKYAEDGSHNNFEKPEYWHAAEAAFMSSRQPPSGDRKDSNNPKITLRDMFGLNAWVEYARIIGDSSSESFLIGRHDPLEPFGSRVQKQARMRYAQMKELQNRIA
jgi:hypothetical protein